MVAVAAAAAAATGAAACAGSPAQAEVEPVVAVTPLSASSVSPSGIPVLSGGATPGGVNSDSNAAVGGGGAGEGEGSTAPPGGVGGRKVGLQLATLFVQRALVSFRRERALKRVVTPPIEFREESMGGSPTLSASFHVPRSANALRVISAMVSADQVMEVKQPILDESGASISFCEKDRTGSLLIRQDSSPGPRGAKDSIHLYRDGGFTEQDLMALVNGYREAWSGLDGRDVSYRFVIAPGETATSPPGAESATGAAGAEKLRQLGVEVHDKTSGERLGWHSLAGYATVKQEIEDTVLLPLRHPEVYDTIALKTRSSFESNMPRAVLFEGPPGTGKTMSARIIAGRSDRPMVHVPVESIMSKWYGESEKKMSAIFDACDEMGGAIIFIDEVDALAGSRSMGMHEATRRVLSVILQKVEGFKKGSKNILICATNRKDDLDEALISRFQLAIQFSLPDATTRREVFGLYAKQLSYNELETLATISAGMSGRDMKEICQHAERRWASKLVKGQETGELPSLKEYVDCVDRRSQEGAWQSRAAQA
eukprot:g10667.t2